MPGFPLKSIKTPCIIPTFPHLHTGALVIYTPSQTLWAHAMSLFPSIYLSVCCLHMCRCLCACMWLRWVCMRVPSLLACLTGSDTSVAFPGESGPVPNCQEINATDSALLLSPRIPPSPCSSVYPFFLSLSVSVSSLSFFLPLSCSKPLLKMEWVCAAYLKWSWMDLNGWWYLVSPQGAAMSP